MFSGVLGVLLLMLILSALPLFAIADVCATMHQQRQQELRAARRQARHRL